MPNMYTLVAPCFFGTEHTLSFEVKRLGAQNVKVTDGRVAFEGDAAMIAAANLNLRTAERVLLLLKTFPATTFDELFDGVYSIPWEELIPVDAQFPVKGSSLSSQLSSVPACQSIVKKAIVKRLQYGHKTTTLPETGALYKIRFALRKNVVEVMLDTSGDGLHKRGYRKNATLAPIKETLAATIADVGFVRRDSTVQDPFCGSGTLVIEAAQKALNIAPGLRRRFAAEHYDFVPAAVWAEERQKALAASRLDAGFEGFGFDIDPNAVALANANAKLAGVGDRCRFEVADVKDFAPRPSSIILTNPPYGERLGDAAEAAVKPGGVIIMLAKSGDGHGGAAFFNTFRDEKNLERMLDGFVNTPRNETIPDQWEAQILARILLKAKVIYISAAPDQMIETFQMTPAKDVNEALALARAYLNNEAATVTVIPDGVAVIVE